MQGKFWIGWKVSRIQWKLPMLCIWYPPLSWKGKGKSGWNRAVLLLYADGNRTNFKTCSGYEKRVFNQRPEIKPEDRKVGYIVVTADKGLAGSYNHNIFKDVEECLKNNSHAKLFVVGEMGRHYFEKKDLKLHISFTTLRKILLSAERVILQKRFWKNIWIKNWMKLLSFTLKC